MASNNSSKTAHVMNMLRKNRASEPAPETKDTAASEPAAAPETAPAASEPAPTAPQAPLLTAINEDAAVASQIKDALEAELSDGAPEAKAAPEPEAVPEPAAAPEAEAPAIAEPEETETVQEAEQAEIPAKFAEQAARHDGTSYVNVMQILVDEKADKYMEMFGICRCERCKADVCAYALNRLPPKYVFMGKNEMIPRLTVYESKFTSDIVAQLLNACRVVMETPHHKR